MSRTRTASSLGFSTHLGWSACTAALVAGGGLMTWTARRNRDVGRV